MTSFCQALRERRLKSLPLGPLPKPKSYTLVGNYGANTDDLEAICLAKGVVRCSTEYHDTAYSRYYKCANMNCAYRILSFQNAERSALYEKFEHNHGPRKSRKTSVSDERFDKIASKSPYKLNLLGRYDDSAPMIQELQMRGISNAEKSCKTYKWYGVERKYYHGGRFQVKFMSLHKNSRFVLYEVTGIKHYASVYDESVSHNVVNVDATQSTDVTASLGDTRIHNLQNATADKLFACWLESIKNDDADNSMDAAVNGVQARDIKEVTLVDNNPSLESHTHEKWKLMGRYNDFMILDEVRNAKNVRCCRMEVKDGITEKYYRCYSCNYKMWSRERGDKCVLYYSGEHNHPFEQLDVKPEIPHTTDSVTSNAHNPHGSPATAKILFVRYQICMLR
uniref:WRKY domain-containing protein n=1 Tax=Panagrellus redivivus TaxID=6233 RepID=A0A7E4ZVG3_PANRE